MKASVNEVSGELFNLSEIAGHLSINPQDGGSWTHFEERLCHIAESLADGFYMIDEAGRHHYSFAVIKDKD